MNEKTISRRRFFKVAGLALGGATVACCGLGYAASQAAPKPQAGQIETPDFEFGEQDGMKKSVLVAYASRTGSTVGVAAAIGETLAGRGYAVDVKPVSENPDPAAYDLVIVGSAVNGGQWLPEAIEFTRDHQQALRIKPAAVFCVHIMNLGDGETSRKNRAFYLEGVRALVTPVDEAFFAGMGANPQDTSPILRWILRTFNIMPEGDCRDWTKIRAWALTVFA